MMLDSINRAVKRYDRKLYVDLNTQGIPCVFRRTKLFVPIIDEGEFKLYNLVPSKDYVMALTEDWSPRTKVREWGIDFVLNRLRDIDLAHNKNLIEEIDRKNEEIDKSNRRHLRSEAEAFFSDHREIMKRQFKDINTSTLDKTDHKQKLRDRRIKDGNY